MKLIRKVGSTSHIFQIFVRDTSSATGAGLTGLVFSTSGLTAYYHRNTDTTATAIVLITMTVGSFTSSGFKEIDPTNMPGWYQVCPPDAAFAAGATSVGFHLLGAANMAPVPIEIDLAAQVDVALWSGTAVTSPDTAGSPKVTITAGTGAGQLDFTSGVVKSNLVQILATALTETAGLLAGGFKKFFNVSSPTGTLNSIPDAVAGASGGLLIAGSNAATTVNITGNLSGSVGSVTGNVGGNVVGSVASVTAPVTAGTVSDKTGYTLTSAYDAAKTAAQVGDIMKVSSGTGANQISLTSGQVTVGTNNDKTGYSLSGTQTFNTTGNITGNLSGSVGSVTSGVTVTTNNDKTGYSLTQAFPTNFSVLAITGAGAVTAGTISDKTGYSLTSAYDAAKTAAQVGDIMKISSGTGANQISLSSGLVSLNLTQAVPTSNTAQTTGDALNAARAQGFGKWVLSGTTLTLYANDGSTAVRTFTLDSSSSPTSRT